MSTRGCPQCFGTDAEGAWDNCGRLTVDAAVVDESHFMIQLRRLPGCSQRFVWIFTEVVDWRGGEDAQYRQILPVTETEARLTAQQGAGVDLGYLRSLGRGRRFLNVDWPSDDPKATVSWSGDGVLTSPGG